MGHLETSPVPILVSMVTRKILLKAKGKRYVELPTNTNKINTEKPQ